jgi:hypothetical protein
MRWLNASATNAVNAMPAQVGTYMKSTSHNRFDTGALNRRPTRSAGRAAVLSGRVVMIGRRPRVAPCSPVALTLARD